jgi:hypothetical protein
VGREVIAKMTAPQMMALDQALAELEVPPPDPSRWATQLAEVARQMRAIIGRHRDLVPSSVGFLPGGGRALRCHDRVLAIIRAGGRVRKDRLRRPLRTADQHLHHRAGSTGTAVMTGVDTPRHGQGETGPGDALPEGRAMASVRTDSILAAKPGTAQQSTDDRPAVWAAGLGKSYGPTVAVADLDLRVAAGETVALLGPNGAGKTTTIGLLLGLLSPGRGQVQVYGRPPSQTVAAGLVGAMLQDAGLMPGVRVGELLAMVRGLYPQPLPFDDLVGLADLGSLLGRRADRLSGGQAQRVRFAAAMLAALDGVRAVGHDRARVTLHCGDPDATVRSLVRSGLAWSGLEVGGPDLETSFLRLVIALAAALPAMMLVALTAVASHDVRLGAVQWLAMLAAMWVGVLPLALLGLAIGYLAGDEIAFPLTMALYFALGALGGLWMPLSAMPHAMQDIAQALPSNAVAELGWRIVGGQASVPTAVLVLAVWTLGSGLVALLAYRRRAIRP